MITIVSGLPRSGTSMMMRMLEAGGITPLIDNLREADEDNLKGYYELERVKQIESDKEWLNEAEGKVVKLISALLKYLPPEHQYRIIFMRRKISEVLASQEKMMERRGEPPSPISDETMTGIFEKHLNEIEEWLSQQDNIKTLYISYNETLEDTFTQVDRVKEFLGYDLDTGKMAQVVDPTLYRQRK